MVDSKKYSSTARTFVNDDPNILEARLQFFW
jgi:phosphate-selective porin OprO/OprP